ncbi:MAG: UPF0175 family protein [Euryarchaeota archaeon]|nr:UPF0175 family protein [Euryarchaeota archaeon]
MKKEELVATRLPKALISDIVRIEKIEQSDRSTVLGKLLAKAITDWKKEYVARLYAENKLTLERAALEAGFSVREMMGYLKQRRVPAQYDIKDLEEDMKNFYIRIRK